MSPYRSRRTVVSGRDWRIDQRLSYRFSSIAFNKSYTANEVQLFTSQHDLLKAET